MWIIKCHQMSYARRAFSSRVQSNKQSDRRSSLKREPAEPDIKQKEVQQELSFRKYRLLPELVNVLENKMLITTPSPIQQLVIPHLIQGKSAIMAAQTGTGKTLAYTLPIIHQLKQQEMVAQTRLTLPNKPRSLILVPNRELAMQVHYDSLKPFQYDIPLKFFSLYPGQSHKIETDKLNEGVDVLVSTFERFQYRRDGDKVFLSNVSSLVIDELDTFLDSGNEKEIRSLIEQFLGTS